MRTSGKYSRNLECSFRYVKLISSDGHEFIVKRDHALTSGTIKAMLSGPGQFAENETNEVMVTMYE